MYSRDVITSVGWIPERVFCFVSEIPGIAGRMISWIVREDGAVKKK